MTFYPNDSLAQHRNAKKQRGLKWQRSLLGLAIAEVVLGIAIFISMLVFIGAMAAAEKSGGAAGAAGFLTGVVAIVSGGLGICAFRRGSCCTDCSECPACPKCVMVSHFVMCIVASVLDFSLICSCIAAIGVGQKSDATKEDDVKAMLAAAGLACFATIAHMICSIVSTAFTCSNWFCGRATDISVAYLPNSDESGLVMTPVQSTPVLITPKVKQGKRRQ